MKTAILCLACAGLLTAGCARRGKDAVTFAVGGAPNEIDFWMEVAKDFETRTGIRIEILRHPTDTDARRQGLIVPLRSGEPDPDVFLMDVGWIAQFAASGWLEPLEPASGLPVERFFGKVIESADRYQGRLIALPVYVDGGLLYYRKDLLAKHGIKRPPRTWDDLIEDATKIQRRERAALPAFYGFLWQGAQYEGLVCNFIEFAGSAGGIASDGKTIRLNLAANVAAVKLMHDLIHVHRISPPNTFTEMKEEEVRLQFQQGHALFERNWPYAWALHNAADSPVKGKVAIAPMPSFRGGAGVATLGGWHIGVSRHSDGKDKALQFLKFVVSY